MCNPGVIEFWVGILSELELVTPIFGGVSSAEDGTAARQASAGVFAAQILNRTPVTSLFSARGGKARGGAFRNM